MPSKHDAKFFRYHYDALDRLANRAPAAQAPNHCFYKRNRLATEIQGHVQRSIFEQGRSILAQTRRSDDEVETLLLATDLPGSVLQAVGAEQLQSSAYMPYGHQSKSDSFVSVLGFNGERPDPVTGHYLLGNGYRAFNPVLMRFNSPDSLSPFGKGGMNSYAYCLGDPVNLGDSNGHNPLALLRLISEAAESLNVMDEVLYTNRWNFAGYGNHISRHPDVAVAEKLFGATPGRQIEALYEGGSERVVKIWDDKTGLHNIKQHVKHRTLDVSVYDVISAGIKGELNGVLPRRANELSVLISEGKYNTGYAAFDVIKKGSKRWWPFSVDQSRQNEIYRQAEVPLPEAFRVQSLSMTISIEEVAGKIRFNPSYY